MNDESVVRSCCFTGYRPNKFPFPLEDSSREYKKFDNLLIKTLLSLIDDGCHIFYTGMAMGFDILAAEAVLFLKQAYPDKDIRLFCAIPFEQQEQTFTNEWKMRYNKILNQCDNAVVLSDIYYAGCYQKRNQYMVDRSDYVLTWYDGKVGGTRNTLKYAEKNLKYIVNINTDYTEEFNNPQFAIELE